MAATLSPLHLRPLDFSRASQREIQDYRRHIAEENISLIAQGKFTGGRTLIQKTEFIDLCPCPPGKALKRIHYLKELIVALWKWIINAIPFFRPPEDPAKPIIVLAKDTLDAAEEQVRAGGKVLVLNMASTQEPGGGFDEGIGSQEEELCWRSDLSGMMFVLKKEDQLANPTIWNLYRQILHTPDITVFRSGKSHSYALLASPFQVGILSCGALVRPHLHGTHYADPADRAIARKLIYNQLHVAATRKYDTLILGAFGCGAFRNPPNEIAQLYHDVITSFFKSTFKKIVFAILDDPTPQAHNPQGNLAPFKAYWKGT